MKKKGKEIPGDLKRTYANRKLTWEIMCKNRKNPPTYHLPCVFIQNKSEIALKKKILQM